MLWGLGYLTRDMQDAVHTRRYGITTTITVTVNVTVTVTLTILTITITVTVAVAVAVAVSITVSEQVAREHLVTKARSSVTT